LHRRLCTIVAAPPFAVVCCRGCTTVDAPRIQHISPDHRQLEERHIARAVTACNGGTAYSSPHLVKRRGEAGHKVLRAQNGGVPDFMADLRAPTDY
ncbi:hypothetical protein PIB30_047976, partial [Stylosanthes scabra]|nr:hypothetical protein [Stylosanthes scabra]